MQKLLLAIKSIAFKTLFVLEIAAFLSAYASGVLAQTTPPVQVAGAWVRTTVPGQMGTGGFMQITAKEPLRLVSVLSPVAGVGEVHEMKMEGDVMKMRALTEGLELPAGKTVELKPGGFHIMLMDLKQALPKDSTVPMTLVFKDAKGQESKLELKVPVSARAPSANSAIGSKDMAEDKMEDHSGHKGHKR